MKLANMQMMLHALRCTIIDFCDDYDVDPMGEFIAEKAAICKLFSIDTVRLVSDEMLEIFGGDGYIEDYPYGPIPSSSIATPALCGLRKVLLPFSASPSLRALKTTTVMSTTALGSLVLLLTSLLSSLLKWTSPANISKIRTIPPRYLLVDSGERERYAPSLIFLRIFFLLPQKVWRARAFLA